MDKYSIEQSYNVDPENPPDAEPDCESTSTIRQQTGGSGTRFKYLFENIQDAVVEFELVGTTPIVRVVNPAFVDIFGYEPAELLGESLNEYIVPDVYGNEAETFDGRTDDGKHNKAVVRRETTDGIRRFLYRGIPYQRDGGESYGFAIYSDITSETRREHRLQVLHRILRHNLRNSLTVINGLAAEIDAGAGDEDVHTAAEEIQAQATDLQHLSDEAARVQRILEAAKTDNTCLKVTTLCDRLVEEYGTAYPDVEFEVETPDSLTISASSHIEIALQQLIENAVEHNDSEHPIVTVAARTTDRESSEWIEIRVVDNGPRIPESEKPNAIADDSTSQLSHGTGLGLRLVQWITDTAGGTVEIRESSHGGNAVVLRFKR